MNRRTLLKYATLNALLLPFALQAKSSLAKTSKQLILIELKGGNDGLNTVVPYANKHYYKLRPTLGIPQNKVLKLNAKVGLHPSLMALKNIFDGGELAIIQGVGYPNPNRSHFRSIEIWDTASKSQEYLDTGWLDTLSLAEKSIQGVVLGGDYGPLQGIPSGVIKINNIQGFLQQARQIHGRISLIANNKSLQHILKTESEIQQGAELLKKSFAQKKKLPHPFKKSRFHKQMRVATQLINSSTDMPFIKVSLGSFDTHTNQANKHAHLLKELSEGISILRQNLIESGKWKDTVIMTYSEFGRRAAENANRGTDHGTAAPHFVIGGDIKGGIYGQHPSLILLDKNRDLIYTTDFRSIYKSVARGSFHTISTRTQKFQELNIFRRSS